MYFFNCKPPPPPLRGGSKEPKLSCYIQQSLVPIENGGVGHEHEHMHDFTAGLFPYLQARDLTTRHGATQPQTTLNKSFLQRLKRNVDVINLLLSFNFLLFTYAHLIERHEINTDNYN